MEMAGNGGDGGRSNGGVASMSAAAAVAGTAETRLFVPNGPRRRWGGCWDWLSCFRSQRSAKRIVPSSRTPDGNGTLSRMHGPQQVGMSNQATTLAPSLLAPPSSPASFSNSALPSTAQSPSCFLSVSANSPGGPSSTMFATGPYAHETQLVSPPVFSTFTTEPSTAPLTPPPELAHLTTPSSPDVPFAQYLSSTLDLKSAGKENGLPFVSTGYSSGNDLRVTYPLCPGSPASSLISPMSVTPRTGRSSPFPEREVPSQWDVLTSANNSPYSRFGSQNLFGVDISTSKDFTPPPGSSLYPAASAQFHLDQAQQSYSSNPACGGRLSVSREGNRHNKTSKQDVEEVEAYRASFGFSADELVTAPSYVEISDGADISFSVPSLTNNVKSFSEQHHVPEVCDREATNPTKSCLPDSGSAKPTSVWEDLKLPFLSRANSNSNASNRALTDGYLLLSLRDRRVGRSFRSGMSSSDAEIDYRRTRSSKHVSTLF